MIISLLYDALDLGNLTQILSGVERTGGNGVAMGGGGGGNCKGGAAGSGGTGGAAKVHNENNENNCEGAVGGEAGLSQNMKDVTEL